ncbi:MAG: zinc-binding dehydrogenase [bacterium]
MEWCFVKAAVLESWGNLVVREVPEPKPGKYQALVKILACSICNGTDSKLLEGRMPWAPAERLPGIIGHESVGRVIKLGEGVVNFKVDDLILRPSASSPGYSDLIGGMAEFGLVCDVEAGAEEHPEWARSGLLQSQQVVFGGMEPGEAAILITMKETYSVLSKTDIRAGKSVVVVGTGPVGLSFVNQSKLMGARPVIALGRRDVGLERAIRFGADFVIDVREGGVSEKIKEATSGGTDYLIDAVGSLGDMLGAKSYLKPCGHVIPYGVIDPKEHVDAEAVRRFFQSGLPSDAHLSFFYPEEYTVHREILDLVRLGFQRPRDFITHRISLEEINRGFDLVKSREAIKVVVEMGR